ncbi:hypothetical protein Cni_G27197 [Canna indica]|uniref:Uncharacterized protein n=1 Tax=Canna indica TaxID=4628 RepID=A0AAQ3L0D8_9LILI|nr:hypothetical protein Cni_G27197 [Canna indica]
MKALHIRRETWLQNNFFLSVSILIATLLPLFCPFFSKVFVFFCPLLISTSVCSAAVYVFILSGKEAANGVFFSIGENSAHGGVLKFYDEINLSICNDNIKMACFFLKSDSVLTNSSLNEEGEKITFAGKLEMDHGTGDFDEGVALLKVDNMAEGVWNYYLGRYSRWHYQKGMLYGDIDD